MAKYKIEKYILLIVWCIYLLLSYSLHRDSRYTIFNNTKNFKFDHMVYAEI